jgi:hypothetical protein
VWRLLAEGLQADEHRRDIQWVGLYSSSSTAAIANSRSNRGPVPGVEDNNERERLPLYGRVYYSHRVMGEKR